MPLMYSPCTPSATRTPATDAFTRTLADHAAETQARGYAALAASNRALLASLPYEAERAPVHPIGWPKRALRMVLAVALSTLAWWGATTDGATASPATPCYEDQPCFVWAKDGNGQRGVIMRDAPRACTWARAQDGCIAIVSVHAYCRAWHAGTIDRKRTPKLRGDAYARTQCKAGGKR